MENKNECEEVEQQEKPDFYRRSIDASHAKKVRNIFWSFFPKNQADIISSDFLGGHAVVKYNIKNIIALSFLPDRLNSQGLEMEVVLYDLSYQSKVENFLKKVDEINEKLDVYEDQKNQIHLQLLQQTLNDHVQQTNNNAQQSNATAYIKYAIVVLIIAIAIGFCTGKIRLPKKITLIKNVFKK